MITDSPKISTKEVNDGFLTKLAQGPAGVKEAEDQSSAFTRVKLRQSAFSRQCIPPIQLANDELDRDVDTDLPKKVVEKEPDSSATFMTFKGTGDRTWFYGDRYEVYFAKIESQRFTKSKFELMTYQNDIREILTDNLVKDMADVEDQAFYDALGAVITANPSQALSIAGPLTGTVLKAALKAHVGREVPPGILLMNKSTHYDILDIGASTVGDPIASGHYKAGVEEEEELFGLPLVTTIKSIIPDDEIWLLSPAEWLGKFFLLQDATVYMEMKADMIEFWGYSSIGMGIGNSNGVTKITLT